MCNICNIYTLYNNNTIIQSTEIVEKEYCDKVYRIK